MQFRQLKQGIAALDRLREDLAALPLRTPIRDMKTEDRESANAGIKAAFLTFDNSIRTLAFSPSLAHPPVFFRRVRCGPLSERADKDSRL